MSSTTTLLTTQPAITVNYFRQLLPEFSDSSIFVDEVIEQWLLIASQLLKEERWRTMYSMGIALFTAHQVSLQRQAMITAQRGGVPGFGLGVVASKSVNGVSISYNNMLNVLKDGGDWNLTTYGVRFLSFARMFGSGGFQVVGSDAATVNESQLIGAGVFSFPNF